MWLIFTADSDSIKIQIFPIPHDPVPICPEAVPICPEAVPICPKAAIHAKITRDYKKTIREQITRNFEIFQINQLSNKCNKKVFNLHRIKDTSKSQKQKKCVKPDGRKLIFYCILAACRTVGWKFHYSNHFYARTNIEWMSGGCKYALKWILIDANMFRWLKNIHLIMKAY